MEDRGSDDLIREAKTWLDPAEPAPPAWAPEQPAGSLEAPSPPEYPSDRIAGRGPSVPPADVAELQPWPAQPERPRGGLGIKLAIVAAALGLLVAGAFVVRSLTASETVGIFAVQPGDCFADPLGASVAEIELVDCTEAHELEAFAMIRLPFGADAPLPDDETLFATAWDECLGFFEPYTGEPYDTSEWYLDAFVPDRHSWKAGDRDALCVVFLADAEGFPTTATRSARA